MVYTCQHRASEIAKPVHFACGPAGVLPRWAPACPGSMHPRQCVTLCHSSSLTCVRALRRLPLLHHSALYWESATLPLSWALTEICFPKLVYQGVELLFARRAYRCYDWQHREEDQLSDVSIQHLKWRPVPCTASPTGSNFLLYFEGTGAPCIHGTWHVPSDTTFILHSEGNV